MIQTVWIKMGILEYKIQVFEAVNGKRPFEEWLNKLTSQKARHAIDVRLERLHMGNFGQCRALGDGVYELKIDMGPGYRVYFGRIGMDIVLLLCGGDKKSQSKDIVKAKEYFQQIKNLKRAL
jgi:putative addiction module killer protein